MKILALDSSGLVAGVAVTEDDNLLGEYTINYKKTHSQTLLPMLDEVAKMIELDLNTIDVIAVSAGPGSFTGLRIGSATAKGLALALNKQIVSVPTVDALAGIPAAVGKRRAPDGNLQHIGFIITDVLVNAHTAGDIAMVKFLHKCAVDHKGGICVDPVKVQIMHLILLGCRNGKFLDIANIFAFKIPRIGAGGRIRASLHGQHGIMGQVDLLGAIRAAADAFHQRAQMVR